MVAERFISAFSAADFDGMRDCLAPDLAAWVTDSDGQPAESESFWVS